MKNNTPTNGNVETRIGRLEGHYESLSQKVEIVDRNLSGFRTEVGNDIGALREDIKEVVKGFTSFKETMTSNIGVATAPKWPLIVSIGSFILTICGMAATIIALLMSGQNTAIADAKGDLKSIRSDMYDAQYNSGKSGEWRTTVSQTLVDLDIKLQREMGLIDKATEAKLKNLDERLQREFQLMGKNIDNSVEEIKRTLGELKAWRLEHSSMDATFHGEVKIAIDGIEKILEHIEHRQYDDRINRLWMKELEDSTRCLNNEAKMSSPSRLIPPIKKPSDSGGGEKP